MSVDAALLEALTLRAWPPAELREIGGWRLAASAGFAGRINSAWALGEPGLELEAAVAAVEGWYRERNLPSRFKLADGAAPEGLDALLAQRGYVAMSETLVMVGPVRGAADPEVVLAGAPDVGFSAVFIGSGGSELEAAERLAALARTPPPALFGQIVVGGEPAAIGGCPVEGEWCGLFAMRTITAHRRKGLARRLALALLDGAEALGARRAYLQVGADNLPAITFYRELGFETAYAYRYRMRP